MHLIFCFKTFINQTIYICCNINLTTIYFQNHDNEMARHSAGTLANILRTLATHRILCEPAAHSSLNQPHLQANHHHHDTEKSSSETVGHGLKRHSVKSSGSVVGHGDTGTVVNSATIDDHMDKLKGDSCEVMMLRLLKHHDHDDGKIDIVREIVRGMSHFLTSVQFQNLTIKFGLSHLVRLLKSKDEEIRYAAIVALRKVFYYTVYCCCFYVLLLCFLMTQIDNLCF